MVQSSADTPEAYLASLPDDRRSVVAAVRELILERLPEGYEESMNWGMLTYEVPLTRYPDTYNKKPLLYAALAAQKNYYSLYLMGVYSQAGGEDGLRRAFEAAGKKLDMGKSCVRFKTLEDLPLEVIGRTIAETPVDAFIEQYETSRKR